MVDGPPFPVGRLLQGAYVSDATRLLNVACSRARGKLVVVAHSAYLAGRRAPDGSLVELLDYLGRHGRWMDARAVLAGYGDPDVLAGAPGRLPLLRPIPPVPVRRVLPGDARGPRPGGAGQPGPNRPLGDGAELRPDAV